MQFIVGVIAGLGAQQGCYWLIRGLLWDLAPTWQVVWSFVAGAPMALAITAAIFT